MILEVLESEINQGTPLIICTANESLGVERLYLDFGVDKVLKKAVSLEKLKESIEECLLLSRDERKLRRQVILEEISPPALLKVVNMLNSKNKRRSDSK